MQKEIVYLQTTDNKIVKKKAQESSALEHTHTHTLIQRFPALQPICSREQ